MFRSLLSPRLSKITHINSDSLTWGLVKSRREQHPYALKLQELLSATEELKDFKVIEMGVSGERTDSMVGRLQDTLENGGKKYEYAVILGGTNDLGTNGVEMDNVFSNLQKMHYGCLKRRIKTFAVTVPQARFVCSSRSIFRDSHISII